MTTVIVDISMSLDGFVTGDAPSPEQGLGLGGEALHHWAMGNKSDADEKILADGYGSTGAVIMGRRTFDVIDGPDGWSEDVGYGAQRDQSSSPPNVVVTHNAPDNPRLSSGFTFVTGGIGAALATARDLAGAKDVVIMGGASVADQFLNQGLADELRIHLAPVILGGGTPFLRGLDRTALTPISSTATPSATHLTYSIPR